MMFHNKKSTGFRMMVEFGPIHYNTPRRLYGNYGDKTFKLADGTTCKAESIECLTIACDESELESKVASLVGDSEKGFLPMQMEGTNTYSVYIYRIIIAKDTSF